MKITGIKNLHARPKPVPAVEEPKEDDDAGAKTGDLKRKLGNQEGAPSSKKQRMDEEDTAVAIVVDDDDTILID